MICTEFNHVFILFLKEMIMFSWGVNELHVF